MSVTSVWTPFYADDHDWTPGWYWKDEIAFYGPYPTKEAAQAAFDRARSTVVSAIRS